MPKITISKEDGLPVLDFDLNPSRSYCLGRSRSVEIRLEAPSISRTHAVLIPKGEDWFICDLGSRHGTWSSQGRVETMQLTHGEWVAMGSAYLWYEDSHDRQKSPITGASGIKAEESVKNKSALLIEGPSPDLPRVVELDGRRPLTVGTTPDCDVKVEDIDGKPIQLGIFTHQGTWQVTSMTKTSLIDSMGLNTRRTPLEPKTTFFAGSLAISVIPVESLQKHASLENQLATDLHEEQPMFDSTDLEVAARSGRRGRPGRPTAA
jgi:pSer/pThr/pTyr-binding forkhead associated (FHA) protein